MKLTLVSHLGSLENKGLAREVNCWKQFHTMQFPMWKGGLEGIRGSEQRECRFTRWDQVYTW